MQSSFQAMVPRLRSGEAGRPVDGGLRACGLALLGGCTCAARCLHRQVGQLPLHPGSPLEAAMAALAVACLWAGLALLIEGTGLFRLMPIPPRAMLP